MTLRAPARLRADARVADLRSIGDRYELTLTDDGVVGLEADPEGVASQLELLSDEVVLRSRLPAALADRFQPPMWPRLLHLREGKGLCVLVGHLQAEAHWLGGHFPGEPILPGVAQLHWAVQLGQALFPIEGRFAGIDALKFQQIMQPGRCFSLSIAFSADKNRLKFDYQFRDGHFSQGRVRFESGTQP